MNRRRFLRGTLVALVAGIVLVGPGPFRGTAETAFDRSLTVADASGEIPPGSSAGRVSRLSDHVVVLIMDGARYDHTFGDPEKRYVPRMSRELAPQGLVLTGFVNAGHTVTVSAHATLTTGKEQFVYGEHLGRFSDPTLFERLRQEQDLAQEDVWLVLGKNKLGQVFDRSLGSPHYRPSTWVKETEDTEVADTVFHVLTSYRPRLLVANFPSVDRRGHAGDRNGYLAAIRTFDTLAAETWRRIQADPVLSGQTTLVITNDHGRSYDDWTSHGDDSEGSRHVMFLALGPTIIPGSVSNDRYSLADLATTTGAVLGLRDQVGDGNLMAPLMVAGSSSHRGAPGQLSVQHSPLVAAGS